VETMGRIILKTNLIITQTFVEVSIKKGCPIITIVRKLKIIRAIEPIYIEQQKLSKRKEMFWD